MWVVARTPCPARALRSDARGPRVGGLINPILLYLGIALGALGVWLALPRKGVSPQAIGGLIAAVAAGLVVLGLSLRANEFGGLPNIYFYIFAAVALGASLRVITHPRPVYAALYFILTVLASAGLYLLLSAEFMAFALIIIYAGAILITYLFVIMLATQAPSEEDVDALSDYDRQSREPLVAAGAGFVLLAVLSTMLLGGAERLAPPPTEAVAETNLVLERLPDRVEASLRDNLVIAEDEVFARDGDGMPLIDAIARTALVIQLDQRGEPVAATLREVRFPDDLAARNVENLAFNFLNDHPMTIEIAGVILLMAMLGATVLSRRQIELDEDAKAQQARARRLRMEEGP